jgi:hypothetical protein
MGDGEDPPRPPESLAGGFVLGGEVGGMTWPKSAGLKMMPPGRMMAGGGATAEPLAVATSGDAGGDTDCDDGGTGEKAGVIYGSAEGGTQYLGVHLMMPVPSFVNALEVTGKWGGI